MLIYFHIDELNRDAVVAAGLRKRMNSQGWHLVYGSRTSLKLLKYFSWLFDAVIIPRPMFIQDFSYRNHVILYTEMVGRAVSKKTPSFSTFCLLGRRIMEGDLTEVDLIKRIYLWGQAGHDLIKNKDHKIAEKCLVVGHPRLDPICLREPKERSQKRKVGLISRQPMLNDYNDRSVFDSLAIAALRDEFPLFVNKLDSTTVSEDSSAINELYNQSSDFYLTLKIIRRLVSAGIDVEVRVHPRENVDTWKKIRDLYSESGFGFDLPDTSVPYLHWASSVDVIVGPISTSYYECAALGIPTISISKLDGSKRYSLGSEEMQDFASHIPSPETIEELIALVWRSFECRVHNTVLPDDFRAILVNEINYPDKSTLQSIVDDLKLNIQGKRATLWRKCAFGLINLSFAYLLLIRSHLTGKSKRKSNSFFLTLPIIKHINSLVS